MAHKLKTESLFTAEEEQLVFARRLAVSKHVLFPFLTAQIKSGNQDASIQGAELQSLRDAAAIVRANIVLAQLADVTSSPVDTCHFSSTCDLSTARLYVHYTLNPDDAFPSYKTKEVYECRFKADSENQAWRTHMRNLYTWVITDRAIELKKVIALLDNTAGTGPGLEDDDTTTTASVSGAGYAVPLSPSSTTSLAPLRPALALEAAGLQRLDAQQDNMRGLSALKSTPANTSANALQEVHIEEVDGGEGCEVPAKKRKR